MNFTPFPILKTERLILQEIKKEDADRVLFLRSNETITKYIQRQKPKNIDDALKFINKTTHQIAANELIYWSIVLKGDPKMIGAICLWNFSKDKKTAELGYELDPQYHGKAIMSEALQCVLNFGFTKLNVNKIEAFTHRNNKNSKKLLISNNFQWIKHRKDKDIQDNIIFEIEAQNYNQIITEI